MPRKKRKPPPPRGPQLYLAGALSVAFVNTAGARKNNRQLGVESYAELVTWGQQAGVLSTLEADRLRRLADEPPEDAEAVYATAARLRVTLARLFLAARKDKGGSHGACLPNGARKPVKYRKRDGGIGGTLRPRSAGVKAVRQTAMGTATATAPSPLP